VARPNYAPGADCSGVTSSIGPEFTFQATSNALRRRGGIFLGRRAILHLVCDPRPDGILALVRFVRGILLRLSISLYLARAQVMSSGSFASWRVGASFLAFYFSLTTTQSGDARRFGAAE